MSLIEHDEVWLAQSKAGIQQIIWDAENVENYRRSGWDVEGPYVPASQLRGAVEERDRLREVVALIDAHPSMARDIIAGRWR